MPQPSSNSVPTRDRAVLNFLQVFVQFLANLGHEDVEPDNIWEAHGENHGIREADDIIECHGSTNDYKEAEYELEDQP